MLQAAQDRYGGPEVVKLRDVQRPEPRACEVLVRVEAAAISPADTAFRAADPFIVRFFAGLIRPKNLVHGSEFAGVIEAVGQGVTRFSPGDAVFGATGTELGTHAEYLRVKADGAIVPRPAHLDPVSAAGLAYSFLTAMPFLRDEAKSQPGQRILINGGSSAIGLCAIQLARHMGAEVTAVCSGPNADLVGSVGAQHVIDYTVEDFTAGRVAYDVIFDVVGKSSLGRCRPVLAPGGVYLTTVPSWHILWAMLARQPGRLATTGLRSAAAKRGDLALIGDLVASGALRPMIDRTYPLSEIVAAHRYVDTGRRRGDVVIVP